jgi:predicted RecB family nuclease
VEDHQDGQKTSSSESRRWARTALQWQPSAQTGVLIFCKLSIGGTTAMAVENDLAELKGIGPKHAATLKEIGVDSIKELRHRNPARLKEMIESRHGKVVGLSEQTVQDWVDAAKDHE